MAVTLPGFRVHQDSDIEDFYLKDEQIVKVCLGMSRIHHRAVSAPTITFVSKTRSSIVFKVTNNNSFSVNVYYEENDTTPDTDYVSVSANTTSANITLSGLQAGTEYTIYARCKDVDLFYSTNDSITVTTTEVTATPTITDYGYNIYLGYYYWKVKNNDSSDAEIFCEEGDNTPETSVGVVVAGGKTSTLTSNTQASSITVYARAIASGKELSQTNGQTIYV